MYGGKNGEGAAWLACWLDGLAAWVLCDLFSPGFVGERDGLALRGGSRFDFNGSEASTVLTEHRPTLAGRGCAFALSCFYFSAIPCLPAHHYKPSNSANTYHTSILTNWNTEDLVRKTQARMEMMAWSASFLGSMTHCTHFFPPLSICLRHRKRWKGEGKRSGVRSMLNLVLGTYIFSIENEQPALTKDMVLAACDSRPRVWDHATLVYDSEGSSELALLDHVLSASSFREQGFIVSISSH